MKNGKYTVISLHPFNDCNISCPMCYRKKEPAGEIKPEWWWFDLPSELAKVTDQIALGGGEPFLHQGFIQGFGKECTKNDLIFNITTNGTVPIEPKTLDDVEMLSVSLDKYKYPGKDGLKKYLDTTKELSKLQVRIGCNLLVEDWMIKDEKFFVWLISKLFVEGKVERIFALLPKKWAMPNILEHKKLYQALSTIYEHFYVDDCTRMIITQNSYDKWKRPCHYGTDMVSINESGQVTGCSFSDEILCTIDNPKELVSKLMDLRIKKRYQCPYLILNQEVSDGRQIVPEKAV